MQKTHFFYYAYIICYVSLMAAPSTMEAFSLKNAFSKIMPRSWETETIHKSYGLKPQGSFTLNNINGNVHIATSSKPTVIVKAIKKAPKKELLETISIKEQYQNNTLTLTVVCTSIDNKEPYVDFHITVPHNTALSISTGKGDIYIEKTTAKTAVSTLHGSIKIVQAQSTVVAQTLQTGNIYIQETYNTVTARTQKGNIVIDKALSTVVASADYGNITVSNSIVPPMSKINLTSTYGGITLWLPQTTNADISARTSHGTVTCQHFVTIKPFTTQLNKHAWRKLRKEVEGTLGTGEAQIMLASDNSSIKILQLKKT